MLTSFTDSSGFKLFVFAILLLISSSQWVVWIREIGTPEEESGNGIPEPWGERVVQTVLRHIHSQLALVGCLVCVHQHHQQRGLSRGGSEEVRSCLWAAVPKRGLRAHGETQTGWDWRSGCEEEADDQHGRADVGEGLFWQSLIWKAKQKCFLCSKSQIWTTLKTSYGY